MSKSNRIRSETVAPPPAATPSGELTTDALAALLGVEPRALAEAASMRRLMGQHDVRDGVTFVKFVVRRELMRAGIPLFRRVPQTGGRV